MPSSSTTSLVVLVLVSACVLLALPATAGAHVSKSHKTAYKKAVAAWRSLATQEQNDLTSKTEMARDMASEMARHVGSQDPQDVLDLLALQQSATAWHMMDSNYWNGAYALIQKGSVSFRTRATPWFKSKADKAAFKKATADLADAFRSFRDNCIGAVLDAELALSQADLPTAWDSIAVSEFAYEAANIEFRDAFKALDRLK